MMLIKLSVILRNFLRKFLLIYKNKIVYRYETAWKKYNESEKEKKINNKN